MSLKDNYKVIVNEERLVEFIDWLPDLKINEKYYLSLFARKKYYPELIKSNDKTQLKRFTATKKNMLNKIKQLEIPLGRWQLRDMEAPQESLVLYIMPNPRCMKKAATMMLKKTVDLVSNNNDGHNIVAEAMSCIQKSKSRSCFVDFDIDDKNIDLSLIENIFPSKTTTPKYGVLGRNIYDFLETKGGYHLLINMETLRFINLRYSSDKLIPKDWYKQIIETFPVDQSADQMIPVPGTYQGGFEPRFI